MNNEEIKEEVVEEVILDEDGNVFDIENNEELNSMGEGEDNE